MSAFNQHTHAAPPFTDTTLRAWSTVPQRFETKANRCSAAGCASTSFRTRRTSSSPDTSLSVEDIARSPAASTCWRAPTAAAPPLPNGSGRGADLRQPGTKPPVRDGTSTCRGRLLRTKVGSNREIRAARTGTRRGRAAQARRQAGGDFRGWVRRWLLPRRPAVRSVHRGSLCEKYWSRSSTCTSSCAPAGLADKTSRPAKGGCTHESHGRSRSHEACGIASSPQMRTCPR